MTEPPAAHRFAHEAMATVFELHCVHGDARYARQAADAAFALVDALEQQLSRFVPNSDVSRLNELAAGEEAVVGPAALECLAIARHMHEATLGAFDVSLGTGLEALDLEPDTHSVRARRRGVRLDLGGIGKGYAVDRAAELLADWGIERALLHGGFSSVAALEAPPGKEGWPVTLSVPGGGPILARLEARRRVFSASGTRKGDHVRDPRTGRAIAGRTAWVSVPRDTASGGSPAAVAEALSTACLILGESDVRELLRDVPGFEAWLLSEEAEGPTVTHLTGAGAVGLNQTTLPAPAEE